MIDWLNDTEMTINDRPIITTPRPTGVRLVVILLQKSSQSEVGNLDDVVVSYEDVGCA